MSEAELRWFLRRDLDDRTLQQPAAARGGTLGIPSVTPVDGLQANIDTQLLGENANLYAQLGGVDISQQIKADAFAELMEQDVPRYLADVTAVQLSAEKLSTAGFRVRWMAQSNLKVLKLQSANCLEAIRKLESLPKSLPETDRNTTVKHVGRDCALDELRARSFHTVSAGVRVMRRSPLQDGGKASIGGAFEAMYSYDGRNRTYSHGAFAGLSGMYLERVEDMLGVDVAGYPRFRVLRVSAGYELRGLDVPESFDIAPRVGVYAVASYGWWSGPPAAVPAMSDWRRSEIEAGAYLGGRFQKSFQGMLAARIVKAFDSNDTTFILSLIPAVTPAKGTH